jgi:hypothetical protein
MANVFGWFTALGKPVACQRRHAPPSVIAPGVINHNWRKRSRLLLK